MAKIDMLINDGFGHTGRYTAEIKECIIADESEVQVTVCGDTYSVRRDKETERDLPYSTPVMTRDDDGGPYSLRKYLGRGFAVGNPSGGYAYTYTHIIPCGMFDYDDPDKWNGTEWDYGTDGVMSYHKNERNNEE